MIPLRAHLAALLALTLLTAVACSSGDDAASAAGPGELTIYSGRSESLVGPVIQEFGDLTGVKVRVNYGSTGALAATLLEEGQRSPADIFFAQDPGGLGAVAGLLGEIPGDTLALVPTWARSPDGRWVGVSGRARTVVYNTDRVSPEDIPATLEGLAAPGWAGRVGWAPANGSFQAMVTAMRLLWGEERTRDWLKAMKANGTREYPKNTPIVAAVGAGEIDVGLVNHYYLHRFLAEEGEGFPARNRFLSGGGPGSVVLAAGVGILETSRNRAAAERFVEFLLSPVAQTYFAAKTFEYPLVQGVATSRFLPPLDTLARPELDLSRLGDLAGTQALMRSVGVLP